MEHVFEEFDEFDCTKLGYATDVEGNLEFWNKYVDHSKVMRRDPNGSIILFDKCKFVYGGDTCDRGYGDLQVLQDLIHLKETYPDRVYLIMGNRDINKLRLPVAMHPEVLSLKPDCYWAHSSSNIDSIPEYVVGDPVSKIKWILLYTMGSPHAFECRRLELQRNKLPSSDLDVANSFCDMVRTSTVTDSSDAVRDSNGTVGLMLRYLELAQIAVIVGDVMFVHGGIHDFNLGWVPTTPAHNYDDPVSVQVPAGNALPVQGYEVSDPAQWCAHINAFAASEVQNYKLNTHKYLRALSEEIVRRKIAIHAKLGITDASSVYSARQLAAFYASDEDKGVHNIGEQLLADCTGGYLHPQPGSALLQYGMGIMKSGESTRSAIYSSYLLHGRPNPCSEKVARWLRQEGIHTTSQRGGADAASAVPVRKLVVGHQPHADAPLILSVHGLQIFSVDSSYSNNTQWPESQLNAIFSTDASFISDTSTSNTSACNTSETKYGILATPLRDDEKWVTFEHYCQQHPVNSAAVGLLQSGEGVGASVGSNAAACTATGNSSAIPPSAHTRSLLCIAEFLFVFAREPIGDSTAECVVQLHGVLSQGSHYYCCLSGSSDCALHMCVAPHSDPYMGRQTSNGWFVKAAGVMLPSSAPHCGTSSIANSGDAYYLLAQSAGYEFRNKLVPAKCIQNEF